MKKLVVLSMLFFLSVAVNSQDKKAIKNVSDNYSRLIEVNLNPNGSINLSRAVLFVSLLNRASNEFVFENREIEIDPSGNVEVVLDSPLELGLYTLSFSSEDFVVEDQTISILNANSVASIQLNTDINPVITNKKVVVTALRELRTEDELAYKPEVIDEDQINLSDTDNFMESLDGKVSGIQTVGKSSAAVGGSTKVRIRGVGDLNDSSALIVIDGVPMNNQVFSSNHIVNNNPGRFSDGGGFFGGIDYGNSASDLNVDDIESISVLKGVSASALYGQKGANGVILITTKRAKDKTLSFEFKSRVSRSEVDHIIKFQDEYGTGSNQTLQNFTYQEGDSEFLCHFAATPVAGCATPHVGPMPVLDYPKEESWGPKLDGREYIPYYAFFEGERQGQTAKLVPQPNNMKEFFDTGITFQQHVAVSKKFDSGDFRFSIGNQDQKGVYPGSKFKKLSTSLKAGAQLTDKAYLSTNFNLSESRGVNRPSSSYWPNVWNLLTVWTGREVNMGHLRNYLDANGNQIPNHIKGPRDLSPGWDDNPFLTVYEMVPKDKRTHLFGSVNFEYDLLDELKFKAAVKTDQTQVRLEQRIPTIGNLLLKDAYSLTNIRTVENNFEYMFNYDTAISFFTMSLLFGGNLYTSESSNVYNATVGGLSSKNYFSVEASLQRPYSSTQKYEKEVRSLFGRSTFGFLDETLYVDLTLRNDVSSTLPRDNNSYSYPSIGTSYIFTDWIKQDWFSYGKVRATWAQVGSDVSPYNIATSYMSELPFNSYSSAFTNTTLNNPNLKPAMSDELEYGFDTSFFNDKVEFSFTNYKKNNRDQILKVSVAPTSGYSHSFVNAGLIVNEGNEFSLNLVPIENDTITWTSSITYASSKTKVVELAEGLESVKISSAGWADGVFATTGKEWGNIIAGAIKRNEEGLPILDPNTYFYKIEKKDFGSALPDYTGGIFNRVKYDRFTLGVSITFQGGGQAMYDDRRFATFSGNAAKTAGLNDRGIPKRNPVSEGGGVHVVGVDTNGNPVDEYIDAQSYYTQWGFWDDAVFSTDFIKINEVSLSYDVPQNFIKDHLKMFDFTKQVRLKVFGKNLGFLQNKFVDGNVDPTTLNTGLGKGLFSLGALPSARTIGFEVQVNF